MFYLFHHILFIYLLFFIILFIFQSSYTLFIFYLFFSYYETDSNSNSNSGYRNQENIRENENKEKGPHREDRGGMRRKYQDLAEAQLKASILLNEHLIYKDIRKRNQVRVNLFLSFCTNIIDNI